MLSTPEKRLREEQISQNHMESLETNANFSSKIVTVTNKQDRETRSELSNGDHSIARKGLSCGTNSVRLLSKNVPVCVMQVCFVLIYCSGP